MTPNLSLRSWIEYEDILAGNLFLLPAGPLTVSHSHLPKIGRYELNVVFVLYFAHDSVLLLPPEPLTVTHLPSKC
jgi:hypothetical protein